MPGAELGGAALHHVPSCCPGACSPLVWVPLVTSILVILLSLVPTAYRLHRKHPASPGG